MSKKVTVTYTVTYDLSEGDIAEEYFEQLNDHEDTEEQRKWFAIDRSIGHHNLRLFDLAGELTVKEN